MAYLQLSSSDSLYYNYIKKNNIIGLKKLLSNPVWLNNIDTIIALPTNEEVLKNLDNSNVCFLADKNLRNDKLLVIKKLPNTKDGGTKTTQQMLYDEDINSDLYNRFGMNVSNPTVTFNDLGGFEEPKEEMLRTKKYVNKGLIQKNLTMFLGVSRSGKSFFAECLAGELKYKLIILDLGVIMSSNNPSKLLDDFFYYLENIDEYVLLIDEIEKVADPDSSASMSKVLIGKLLTIFNNFNSESGFNIKSNFVIATANNIMNLLDKNPEFINRFGLKYFVNYPQKDTFINVSNYYLSKMGVKGISGDDLYRLSSSIYAKDEIPKLDTTYSGVRYGKYASGEIKEFMSTLLLFCDEKDSVLYADKNILNKVLRLQKPQIQFAKKGVIKTIEAAKTAQFREVG